MPVIKAFFNSQPLFLENSGPSHGQRYYRRTSKKITEHFYPSNCVVWMRATSHMRKVLAYLRSGDHAGSRWTAPKNSANRFVEFLTRLSSTIPFSAAIPGQGGTGISMIDGLITGHRFLTSGD